ncbi:MAG: hypothetical protein A2W23_06525 [Planctomycetes bacterium RBG_16_43_13]|nr:MAG: hypothetical protein A2W23_06525 [Planctomycetes bacterium RBG_16_43_13]
MKYEMTKGERFVYFWQHNMLGSFMSILAEAISAADAKNTAKLALGFPEEVEAMRNFSNMDGWWVNLREKVQAMKEENHDKSNVS